MHLDTNVLTTTNAYILSSGRAENDTKTLLTATVLAIAGLVTVQAADITPATGHLTRLGEHFSALVYYIDGPEASTVVVTTQQGARKKAAVARFETVLAEGQSAVVSIPRPVGEPPARIVFSNAGDHLHITEHPASVAVQ